MTPNSSTGQAADGASGQSLGEMFDPEELRRRNLVSLGMDVLILVTTGFLSIMFTMGFWPSMIALVPVGTLLYFGWASSRAFFVSQLLAIALALIATYTYMLPY